jgi:serine/threonine-protein kinase
VAQINKSLTLAPDSAIAHQLLGATYVQQKNYDAAIRELANATRTNAGDAGNLGHAYAVAGNRAAATRILNDLLKRSQREYVKPLQIALIYIGIGDTNDALDYLERAYRENEGVVLLLATDPRLAPISGNPRFQSILRRGGLTYRQDLAAH